ncbi:hypothetical protein EHS25_002578 [Saitozyma podzolica]|uniref:Alcohol dehydrogenase-like N-terminal domain-containing protein n=1 Tax=Saitozyma podzolica TaxID=1890683 RepID=A0A427YCW3_9TREE|nr:hypothetical protein EHS25_002578 [Saitozyma podzolica]
MSHFHCMTKTQPSQVTDLNLPPNTSCVLLKKRTVSVRDEPLPILQPDGVLVRTIATGEVIAVGDLVTTHKVGDRVAVEPGLPCRRCENCKGGRSNICLDMKYCGAPGCVGSLAKFSALPADMAPHIPDGVSWEEAGCIQPLAIGVQIGKRVDLRAHQTVAIFGCGPIGLITAAVAHAYSARKIIAFDINPSRVEFARKYISPLTGKPIIDHVFHIADLPKAGHHGVANGNAANAADTAEISVPNGDHEHKTPGDIKWTAAQERMREIISQVGLDREGGVDRVVEASGAEDGMLHGVAIAKQGAIYLQVGLGHIETHHFPLVAVTNKELDIRGITRYTASCFPSAIDLLSRGVVDLKPLITITFPLSKSADALEAVASGKQIKVIIKNQE